MKIKLLSDYRGVLTGEIWYPGGIYEIPLNMPQAHADALIEAGRAEVVPVEQPKQTPAPARRTRRKKAAA
jgi:hypothetical protein